MPTSNVCGRVEAIAYRPTDGEPMQLIEKCEVVTGRGITLENRPAGKRELTLLSAESWEKTCHDLGMEIPWYSRRANILIRGIDLASAVGRSLTVGSVRLQVHGETRPCGIMDEQHQGLKAALVPDCRGGVHAEVFSGGVIRIGDSVTDS